MSDYYWPQNMPTALHINYIAQIKYTIHATNHDYFEVKQTNLINGVTKHRVYLPEYYRLFFMKFLWRLYLALRLYSTFRNSQKKKVRSFRPQLLLIITHLDNVLEAIVRPAVNIEKEDISDWRNVNFDEYLITEFLLGRHDPATVETFRYGCKTNIERMNFADLGRQTIHFLIMSSLTLYCQIGTRMMQLGFTRSWKGRSISTTSTMFQKMTWRSCGICSMPITIAPSTGTGVCTLFACCHLSYAWFIVHSDTMVGLGR